MTPYFEFESTCDPNLFPPTAACRIHIRHAFPPHRFYLIVSRSRISARYCDGISSYRPVAGTRLGKRARSSYCHLPVCTLFFQRHTSTPKTAKPLPKLSVSCSKVFRVIYK